MKINCFWKEIFQIDFEKFDLKNLFFFFALIGFKWIYFNIYMKRNRWNPCNFGLIEMWLRKKILILKFWFPQRNERREREQRELVKKLREETLAENFSDALYDESASEVDSSTANESLYEVRNRWHSAEDVRNVSHPLLPLSPLFLTQTM